MKAKLGNILKSDKFILRISQKVPDTFSFNHGLTRILGHLGIVQIKSTFYLALRSTFTNFVTKLTFKQKITT